MAIKAYLTQYLIDNVAVANVKSIKPPKMTAKDIDTTTLESPDEFEEALPGLGSGGEAELTLNYTADEAANIYANFRVVATHSIAYPNGGGWTFDGWISELGDEEVKNGEIIMTGCKVKVTGKPTVIGGGS